MPTSLLDYYHWEQSRLIAEGIKRQLFSPAMLYLDNFGVSDIPLLLHQDDSDILMQQHHFQDMSNNQLLYQLRMVGACPSPFLTHETLVSQLEAVYNVNNRRTSSPYDSHPAGAPTSRKRSHSDTAEEHVRALALASCSKKQCRTKSFDSGYISEGAYPELAGFNSDESSCNEEIVVSEDAQNLDMYNKTQGLYLDEVHVWQHPTGHWRQY